MLANEGLRISDQGSETIFAELRKTNDKYIEQQNENRKLRDQVHHLQLQIEDLKLHNTRYQAQAQTFQTQIAMKSKKTRTARTGGLNSSFNDISNTSQSQSQGNDLEREILDLCIKIDQFFNAMKMLQRAVNQK